MCACAFVDDLPIMNMPSVTKSILWAEAVAAFWTEDPCCTDRVFSSAICCVVASSADCLTSLGSLLVDSSSVRSPTVIVALINALLLPPHAEPVAIQADWGDLDSVLYSVNGDAM